MTLTRYVRKNHPEMSIEEFHALEADIDLYAGKVMKQAESLHETDTGVYWPTSELTLLCGEYELYIRQSLKLMGMEFIENGTLYRV